jgi:hypothetical protein
MADKAQCQATTAAGKPCRGVAAPGSAFCPFHDPSNQGKLKDSRRRGGKSRSKPAATAPVDSPDLPCRTPNDVAALMEKCVNEVRKGLLDPRIANSVAYLTSNLLKAVEAGEMRDEIAALKATLAERLPGKRGKL